MTFGGARYIATGRGFATARIPFGVLYSRFATPALYLGARMLLFQLFATATIWGYWLTYFWASLIALITSPFLFNPHQFAWNDFFIDYRDYLRWLSRGNSKSHASSWIAFVRLSRTRITGYKRKYIGEPTKKLAGDIPRAGFSNVFIGEIVAPAIWVVLVGIPYIFMNSQVGNADTNPPKVAAVLRIAVLSVAPLVVNGAISGLFFALACCMGPLLGACCKRYGAVLAAIAHAIAVIILVACFEALFFLEGWNFPRTVAGVITMLAIQRFLIKVIVAVILPREIKVDNANIAWWTGSWFTGGWYTMSQPFREWICKITELTMFGGDFMLGHVILFVQVPIIIIPFADKFHSVMLFWLRPSKQIRPPIYSLKQSKLRSRRVIRYSILFFLLFAVFVGLIVGPVVGAQSIQASTILKNVKPGGLTLYQPTNGIYNDTHSSIITGTNIKNGLSQKTQPAFGSNVNAAFSAAATNAGKRDLSDGIQTALREMPALPLQTLYMEY